MATLSSIDPSTGELIASFDAHGAEHVERVLQTAADAVPQLAALGWAGRRQLMERAAELLEGDVDELSVVITREMGKPIAQARAEIAKSAYAMRFYARNAEDFLRGSALAEPSDVGASAASTRYDPLGVVLAVMPWNYPIWQVVRFAAPALMAGNAGVLKHASNVPQSALYLGELFTRAGFPEGAFSALLIGSGQVADIIRDDRVRAVTLTGSEGAGRAVARQAGEVLKKTVLELGGSDPFIVMPSADVPAAARMAVKARITNNGQACINAKRFIVHEDVYDEFAQAFVAGMRALKVGDPLDETVDLGPLSTRSGREDIAELVEDARAAGAEILTGGRELDRPGWYYEPTIVAEITPRMRLWSEEAFGPVASLYRARSFEHALELANGLDFGLGSAFWSTDEAEIEQAVAALEAGAVFVNGMTISYPELPFGGIKRSGYGRELSLEGIREFCNLKTVWRA